VNRQITLAARPVGFPQESDFELVETPVPEPGPGQVLVRSQWLSLDPYMRGRMDEGKSYAKPVAVDEVMGGGTVGEVVESRHPDYAVSDRVVGPLGWQLLAVTNGAGVRKLGPTKVPLTAFLGVVGMPGVTAWYGLNRILEPKAGQTLCVSAASGAVGSVVGQLAKAAGCRVVGIAGGPQKCALVVEEFGFDACIDHKAGDLDKAVAAATPDGVDLVFENVGGAVLDALLARMNAFGRIAVCGLIAGYNGQDIGMRRVRSILVNRLRVQGFIIRDHLDIWPQALAELAERVGNGSLKYRETIAEGLERAPEAFIGLLKGGNLGKQLVRLAAENAPAESKG
jgi:NADPH-dependent curcumin reductase CurA